MSNQYSTINLGLTSIEETNFTIKVNSINSISDIHDINIGLNHHIDTDEVETLTMQLSINYKYINEVVLESSCRFVFTIKELADFLSKDKDGNLIIKNIVPYLLDVGVGTMRGIIVAHTAGTALSKLPLPLVNIDDLAKALEKKDDC